MVTTPNRCSGRTEPVRTKARARRRWRSWPGQQLGRPTSQALYSSGARTAWTAHNIHGSREAVGRYGVRFNDLENGTQLMGEANLQQGLLNGQIRNNASQAQCGQVV